MGLFKEIYCAACGKKASILTRTKLSDGNYLCSDCFSKIPFHMSDSFCSSCSLDDYYTLMDYIDYSDKTLRPIFTESHSYYCIHIDTEHRLFYIGDIINKYTVFYHMRYIDDYGLKFSAEEFKEGMLGDKVSGKILFRIGVMFPYFYYEKILDRNAKAKAKKAFFGSEVRYENPKGMDDFILFFNSAIDLDNEYFYASQNNDCDDENNSEIQKAVSLFMIDNLDNLTLTELKEMRNRLIKTFHPDKNNGADTKYAQKINNSYEILKDYLAQK